MNPGKLLVSPGKLLVKEPLIVVSKILNRLNLGTFIAFVFSPCCRYSAMVDVKPPASQSRLTITSKLRLEVEVGIEQ